MDLQPYIQDLYNLDLALSPLGLQARGNVYEGVSGSERYIVKVEDRALIDPVRLSIKISSSLTSPCISSSRYVRTTDGDLCTLLEGHVITVQHKEPLTPLTLETSDDIFELGRGVAEFHSLLRSKITDEIRESDVYRDFMYGEVPCAQREERLTEIEKFYGEYTPDYEQLTNGVIHNDLHDENIYLCGTRYFFLDFEHVKRGPLISDLGVLSLSLWEHQRGIRDYEEKLGWLIKGYETKIPLSYYEKKSIVLFSLRYLYSDENWYTYWASHGNPAAVHLIPEIRTKQNLLYSLVD